MIKLLIVEKTGEIRSILEQRFSSDQVSIENIRDIDGLLDKFRHTTYDILIWDTKATRTNESYSIELLEVLSVDCPRTQVVIITDPKDVRMAIDGIRAGAFQYLKRPIDEEELCFLTHLALEKQPVIGESKLLSPEIRMPIQLDELVGNSIAMQSVYNKIKEAAASDITVLITGETGTGKDLVAASIHRRSERMDHPYIPVNTGAMSPELIASELFGYEKGTFTGAFERRLGQFEQADGGTLFLDEISTMDEKAQVSLLRLLEKKNFRRLGGKKAIKVDVRVIAATNEDLEKAIAEGHFRRDLYYRFDVFRIDMPPLRRRAGDILLLTKEFITHFNDVYNKVVFDISPETVSYLENYPWPGNVRELKNVIQRAILMAREDVLTPDLLPHRLKNAHFLEDSPEESQNDYSIQVGMTLGEVEKEFISMTLSSAQGNKKETAKVLGISRRCLYNKLEKYGLM